MLDKIKKEFKWIRLIQLSFEFIKQQKRRMLQTYLSHLKGVGN
jgi:hypothetical protein